MWTAIIAPWRKRQCTPLPSNYRAGKRMWNPTSVDSYHHTIQQPADGRDCETVGTEEYQLAGWVDKFKAIADEGQLAKCEMHFTNNSGCWNTRSTWINLHSPPGACSLYSTVCFPYQLKPCLFAGVCFSSRAVSCSRESFWSRFICNTDWQLIWSCAEAKLGLWEFWKLGQRSFCGLYKEEKEKEIAPIKILVE